MGRFIFTLFWLIVVLGVDVLAFLVIKKPLVGAIVELLLFIITMAVPYLRKEGSYTRYWGYLALLSAISLGGLAFGG